jgi:enoyl-[acyl-carrier protein] reductase II
MNTKINLLFGIQYPIVQAGMVWVSGWRLASAVSNCGGLGLIGAGSMKPELLKEHIQKCKNATDKPFGVNIPLLRKDANELIKASLD